MEIFLSICIPTFNRAEIVYRTVKKCLEYNSDKIEVVVSDNCSDDNTEELLMKIDDKRFKYFKNKYNNGFNNLVSVLTYACGDYLLLTSDEDEIVLENLEKLIDVLNTEKPAILLGGALYNGVPYKTHKNGLYSKGYEALRAYGRGCSYISGYVYCKRIMDIVLNGLHGTDINNRFGYSLSFTNLAREMLSHGRLSMREEFLTNHREDGIRDMESHFYGGNLVYSPEAMLRVAMDSLDSLLRVDISEKEKYILCRYYMNKIVLVTYVGDYKFTFDEEFLSKISKEKGSGRIYEYYLDNKSHIVGNQFYDRLSQGIKQYNEYIDKIGMFKESYDKLSDKYPDVHFEYLTKEKNFLEEFKRYKEKNEIDIVK